MAWEGIFAYSVIFIILLYIIGHPIVSYLGRRKTLSAALANLDFVQRLPVEIVLGGSIVYFWALVTTQFDAFNAYTCWALLVTSVALYIYSRMYLDDLKAPGKRDWYSLVALGAFLFALAVRVIPLPDFSPLGSSDLSVHAYFVYAIIQQHGIPFYLNFIQKSILSEPQGLQAVLAYFSIISGLPSAVVVFYELAFFNATIILAAYLLGSVLMTKTYGLIVSLLLINISLRPITIDWGGNWIPWGLTIFLTAVALFNELVIKEKIASIRHNTISIVLLGIFFGYLASVYPPLFILSIPIALILILLNRRDLRQAIITSGLSLALSFAIFSYWLYRQILAGIFSPANSSVTSQIYAQRYYDSALPTAQLFFPYRTSDPAVSLLRAIGNWITWPLQQAWPGQSWLYVPLIVLGIVSFIITLETELVSRYVRVYCLAVLITVVLWGLDGPLGLVYYTGFGLGIMVSELNKAYDITSTILLPFVAALALALAVYLGDKLIQRKLSLERLPVVVVVGLLVVTSLVILPTTNSWLVRDYGIYHSTSNNDYELLIWMKTGIPNNSIVLVNQYDAGQYVATVASKLAVGWPSSAAPAPPQYYIANQLIEEQIMNSTTVASLRSLNISYVFVGSKASQDPWQPRFFIDNPLYFQTLKNIGSSYLFKFSIPANTT